MGKKKKLPRFTLRQAILQTQAAERELCAIEDADDVSKAAQKRRKQAFVKRRAAILSAVGLLCPQLGTDPEELHAILEDYLEGDG